MKLADYIRAYVHVMHKIPKHDFQSGNMLLKKGIEVSGASRLKALSPFLDENYLIRARGRLTKASILMTACHPIILDGNNAAVRLLVQHTHEINCHCGPDHTRKTLSWNTIGYFAVEQLLNRLYDTVWHVVECCKMLAPPDG